MIRDVKSSELSELSESSEASEVSEVPSKDSEHSDYSEHSDTSDYSDRKRASLPTDKRGLGRCLFNLAKDIRVFLPLEAINDAKPYFTEWYDKTVEIIPELEFSSSWAMFRSKWKSVKFASGEDPLDIVMRAVAETEPPECAKNYDGKVATLVHILQRLQIEVGDGPFYISGRVAARLLGWNQPEVSISLNMLVDEGVIRIAREHTAHSARRYYYVGDF